MRVTLYYSSEHTLLDTPDNAGFDLDKALSLLEKLVRQGKLVYEVIDTSRLSSREVYEAYTQATIPAVVKGRVGYNIKHVYGSRRKSGVYFGREIPALLVYEEGENPSDVYPHRLGEAEITIKEFLESLT
jgi:hypothetical protein